LCLKNRERKGKITENGVVSHSLGGGKKEIGNGQVVHHVGVSPSYKEAGKKRRNLSHNTVLEEKKKVWMKGTESEKEIRHQKNRSSCRKRVLSSTPGQNKTKRGAGVRLPIKKRGETNGSHKDKKKEVKRGGGARAPAQTCKNNEARSAEKEPEELLSDAREGKGGQDHTRQRTGWERKG